MKRAKKAGNGIAVCKKVRGEPIHFDNRIIVPEWGEPLLVGGKPVAVDDSFAGLDGEMLAEILPGLERFYSRLEMGRLPDAEDWRTLDLAGRLAATSPMLPAFVGAASRLAERVRGERGKCFPEEAALAECKAHLGAVRDWKGAYFCHLRSAAVSAVDVAEARADEARGAAELAAVRAELAEVKGDKAESLKWKEVAESEKARAARLEGECDALRGWLGSSLAEIGRDVKAAKHAAAGAHAEAARGRIAAEGARAAGETAARAAMNAETAARGNKREKAIDGDLVKAFREFDARVKMGRTQMEIMEVGFLDDMRETKKLALGSCDTSRFLKLWREWARMGRPDAEAYNTKRRRGR